MERPVTQVTDAGPKEDWRTRVEAIAREELRQSSLREVRRVKPCVQGRILRLTGRVSSFYLKQMAQAAVMHRLEGVVAIENEIVVDSPVASGENDKSRP